MSLNGYLFSRLDSAFELNSSLGIRLMDFDVHIMIVGAFKHVGSSIYTVFHVKIFLFMPIIQCGLIYLYNSYDSCIREENVNGMEI